MYVSKCKNTTESISEVWVKVYHKQDDLIKSISVFLEKIGVEGSKSKLFQHEKSAQS